MKRRSVRLGSVLLAAVVIAALSAGPAFASPLGDRMRRLPNGQSTNWSGYAALGSLTKPAAGAVSEVEGTWTVPAVTGTGAKYSATWVGIDGYASTTVEQCGTEQDLVNGVATYSAWWEMYPKFAVTISTMTIDAGDVMSGKVEYIGNKQFRLTISDTTKGTSFSTDQFGRSAKRSSAEWILESPSASYLPNFGTQYFGGAYATLLGTRASISNWAYDAISLVDTQGNAHAVPTGLTNGGTDFTIKQQ